jgi:1,4-dihydroxy-2-naphthoate octaprenyltransferase
VGTALAYADGTFSLLPALAAALGALLLQIGSNFANDYFDFVKGADTVERVGPTRVAASGLLSLTALRMGMLVVFGLAAVIGVYLIAVAGWPILVIGIAAILAAVLYTGGPFPFGYYGLGDPFVFIFFGLVAVCGTYFVQAQMISATVVLAAVPVGCLITAILVVNNYRDIATDRQAGKHTLAVRLGERGTRTEYYLLLGIAWAIPLWFWLAQGRSILILLPWLASPLAWQLIRQLRTLTGPALNQVLAGTARLSLIFSILFAVGLLA